MKKFNKIIKIIMSILIILGLTLLIISKYIIISTKNNIVEINELKEKKYDAIVVLGAGIVNKEPSKMLKERLDTAIEIYNKKPNKIIMSGDNGSINYNEVIVMKNYALNEGIPEEDIFMDHAGFSTYESIYRAKEIFGVNNMIIVSQKYHLYRALFIAKAFDIKAVGIDAMKVEYSGQKYRESREKLARIKDFIFCIIKPKPTYLGEKININE